MKLRHFALATSLLALSIAACSPGQNEAETPRAETQKELPALEGQENYTMLISGVDVGGMDVTHSGGKTAIDFEYRNNGRGPTIKEDIVLGPDGIPDRWTIKGATTFGSQVDESFDFDGTTANWTDTTGTISQGVDGSPLYVAQNPSPYALWLYARVLLADADQTMTVLPGGDLSLRKIEEFDLSTGAETETVSSYALSGIGMNPSYFVVDSDQEFIGMITPETALLKTGYETHEASLRERATEYSARRFEDIQKQATQTFDGPVRITNVRVFDPETLSLTDPVSVVFEGNTIQSVDAADSRAEDETVIDGAGGTLIAGLYEMHGHLGQNNALLNVAAGITTVRDMGNDDDVLGELINKIKSGRLAGPRIIRSGFIEGKSPFSSNSGTIVSRRCQSLWQWRFFPDQNL